MNNKPNYFRKYMQHAADILHGAKSHGLNQSNDNEIKQEMTGNRMVQIGIYLQINLITATYKQRKLNEIYKKNKLHIVILTIKIN